MKQPKNALHRTLRRTRRALQTAAVGAITLTLAAAAVLSIIVGVALACVLIPVSLALRVWQAVNVAKGRPGPLGSAPQGETT